MRNLAIPVSETKTETAVCMDIPYEVAGYLQIETAG